MAIKSQCRERFEEWALAKAVGAGVTIDLAGTYDDRTWVYSDTNVQTLWAEVWQDAYAFGFDEGYAEGEGMQRER